MLVVTLALRASRGECAELFVYLPEIIGDEMPLLAILAPNDNNSFHEGDAVDLPRKGQATNTRSVIELCSI